MFFFKHEGQGCITKTISPEGLDWAIERKYDLILTDIRMPDVGA